MFIKPPYDFTKSKNNFINFFMKSDIFPFYSNELNKQYFANKFNILPNANPNKYKKIFTSQTENYTFSVNIMSNNQNNEFEFTIKIDVLMEYLKNKTINFVPNLNIYNSNVYYNKYTNEELHNIENITPVILLKAPNIKDINFRLVIDGSHRLSTSYFQKLDLIPCYILSVNQLASIPDLFYDNQDKFLLHLIFELSFLNAIRILKPQFSDDQLQNLLTTIQNN